MIKDDILAMMKLYPDTDFSFDQILEHLNRGPRYRKMCMDELQKMAGSGTVSIVNGLYRLAPSGIRKKVLDQMAKLGMFEDASAKKAGVDADKLKKWFRGAQTLNPDEIGRVATALGGQLVIDVQFES